MNAGYVSNDNVLWCTATNIAGTEDTTAAVTAEILEPDGTVVQTGLTLSHVVARSRYEVTPDETLWTTGSALIGRIAVAGTGGEQGSIDVPFRALRRTA